MRKPGYYWVQYPNQKLVIIEVTQKEVWFFGNECEQPLVNFENAVSNGFIKILSESVPPLPEEPKPKGNIHLDNEKRTNYGNVHSS